MDGTKQAGGGRGGAIWLQVTQSDPAVDVTTRGRGEENMTQDHWAVDDTMRDGSEWRKAIKQRITQSKEGGR